MGPAPCAAKQTRGPQTRFFSFVDTVSARNYAGTNDPHGWIGLRFQLQPGGPPNDIVLHVNMLILRIYFSRKPSVSWVSI